MGTAVPNSELIFEKSEPEKVLTQFFSDNRSAIRRFVAGRMSKNLLTRVDPSDVVQETFIEARRRLNSYVDNPRIPLLKWLFLLAEQNVKQSYRRHVITTKRSVLKEASSHAAGPLTPVQAMGESDATDPILKAERSERIAVLEMAIKMLPPLSESIVRLRFLEGKQLAEIAVLMNVSKDVVAKRIMRSLQKLSDFASEFGLEMSD